MSALGRPVLPSRKTEFRNISESRHSKCSLACLKSARNGSEGDAFFLAKAVRFY
jgi:hypothetical protein